ncbi:response regulator [Allorhizobium undicola]|uniref:response regulator n=1 Tax=Allorhizobium undicola TaxID=78527 RepID=UPI0004892E25|nr:response regulator [Allorhizobium undicola]
MERHAMTECALERGLLDAVCDTQGSALLVIDRDDLIVYGSPLVLNFFPVSEFYLRPGTRLRDFLGAVHDHCIRLVPSAPPREEWIAERVSAQWRERWEDVERTVKGRMMRLAKRRLPSGFGLCVMTDVTEQKKRDEQWKTDQERIEVTEEILDSLPHPLFVLDEDRTIVAVNRAVASAAGAGLQGVQGEKASAVFAPAFLADLERTAPQLRANDAPLPLARPGIWLSSAMRAGRLFTMVSLTAGQMQDRTLFLSQPHAETGKETPSLDLAGMRVLAISSDAGFNQRMARLLAQAGADSCTLDMATDMRPFLAAAHAAGVAIDLVLVDRRMPPACAALAREHGLATIVLAHDWADAMLIRQIQSIHSETETVTEAAPAFRAAAAGTTQDEGHARLAAAPAPMSSPEPLATAGTGLPDGTKADPSAILVVEDNDVNQIVFSQILEGLGCRYTIAASGAEALRIWTQTRPDVVLMDISLPDINGLELTRAMRRHEENTRQRSLIVGVLVPAFDQDKPKCLAAGMDDAIVKPLSPDMIEHLLSRHGLLEKVAVRA